ncbi:MAG: metal ABC transporter substrate-binding protein [Bacilli bacterium]|nr:metal ABC transporter substrate-binding protein [Bacilli bacterium]
MMGKHVLALLFPLACLVACSSPKQQGPLVVCSIYPEYEWTKAIIGENKDIQLALLQDTGADLHSFQPRVSDIVTLSKADVFIYNGGESDEWVEKALENVSKPQIDLNLMEEIEPLLYAEEHPEGMQGEAEEEEVYDEHIWLSLRLAFACLEPIVDALSTAFPSYADSFEKNALQYGEALTELDARFASCVKNAKTGTLLFADRFPFLYLSKDYGLHYFAAFAGCSTDAEASVQTIRFLVKMLDETGLRHVSVLENSDRRLAETVIDASKERNQTIVSFDSMQSMTLQRGKSYLEAMEHNLFALQEALS